MTILLRCFLLLGVLCGCQSKPAKEMAQEVSFNVIDEPQILDPRRIRDLTASTMAKMLFEGLTRVNPQDVTELALAERVDISPDLKTYTFHLRQSLWTNGDPVTAQDFAHSWKKVLSPDFPTDTAFLLYVIKNAKAAKEGKAALDTVGICAIDALTLKVELENPTPYFLDLLAFPVFFPVHQKSDEENPGWFQKAESYVGNGPFRFVQWKHQDHLTVEKNLLYWDAAVVKLDRLQMCMVKEETELNMFEKGELDWAGSPLSILPVEALRSLKQSPLLKTKEILGTNFMRVNTQRAPMNHPKIRKAFALAMNRQLIVDHVTQGNQIPATGFVPLSCNLQEAPYFADGDALEAKNLFQQGLAALQLQPEDLHAISLIYRMGERNHLVVQAIQQQWFEAFGIRVKVEALESKVLFDRISKQDYHLALGNWIADFADPINFLEVFKSKNSGSNNTHWENARYVDLLEQSNKEANAQARRHLLAEAEKILMDEMPIIPIFYVTMLYLNQPQLKDVVLSSMGAIDFKWASKEI